MSVLRSVRRVYDRVPHAWEAPTARAEMGLDDVAQTLYLHDTTHNPVALWQFNGDMLDSGSAGENLTLETGTTLWAPGPVPGTRAFNFNGATRLVGAATAAAALRITGDMTVEALVRPGTATTIGYLALCAGDLGSETEANNMLWALRFNTQQNLLLDSSWENGAGVNNDVSNAIEEAWRYEWLHVAVTREANVGKLWLQGRNIATSGVLSAPTGGTSARIRLGCGNVAGQFISASLSSVKVCDFALSQAQLQDEVRRTMPRNQWGF